MLTPLRSTVWLLVLALGCTGRIDGDPGDGAVAADDEPSDDDEPPVPNGGAGGVGGAAGAPVVPVPPRDCTRDVWAGASPARRLARAELDNTFRVLLGDTSSPAARLLPPDSIAHGFDTDALGSDLGMPGVRQLMLLAEDVAGRATANVGKLLACGSSEQERACVERFIAAFGERAFRRPLDPDERTHLLGTFDARRAAAGTLVAGVRAVIEEVVQSPPFLYLTETRGQVTSDPRVVRVTGTDLAARLAYMIVRGPPDETLLAAAREGRLENEDGLRAEVTRLLALPEARAAVVDFHRQWLGFDEVLALAKDTTAAPWATPAARTAMVAETNAFVERTLFEDKAGLPALLGSVHSFISAELAPAYGLANPVPAGPTLTRVELDPKQRAGLLTHASLLASLARANDSAPVKRGLFVLERLLCHTIAAPPASLDINTPPSSDAKTTRALFEAHSADAACRPCHDAIDPIGFAFERYDGLGRYRTTENGVAVDPSGVLAIGDPSVDGPIEDAVALAHKLAASPKVRACVVDHVFRYAMGRAPDEDDMCLVRSLERSFVEGTGNVVDLWTEFATSEAFSLRRAAP